MKISAVLSSLLAVATLAPSVLAADPWAALKAGESVIKFESGCLSLWETETVKGFDVTGNIFHTVPCDPKDRNQLFRLYPSTDKADTLVETLAQPGKCFQNALTATVMAADCTSIEWGDHFKLHPDGSMKQDDNCFYIDERHDGKLKYDYPGHLSCSPATTLDPNDPILAPPMELADSTPINNSGKIGGDPHVVTWSGHKFDFHGGCDLVLVDNPEFANGLGLTIHVRTVIRNWWSHIKTAVIRIGQDTIELMGGEDGQQQYWINGHVGKDLADGEVFALAGFKVIYRNLSKKQQKFRIELGSGGNAISMESYKDFVQVNVKVNSPKAFENTIGLLGKYPSGEMVARDKTTVLEDPIDFGMEWQVRPDLNEPMLFHDLGDGVHHPTICAMPSSEASATRRLGEATISEEDAALACARVNAIDRDSCIFDVLATNDKDMAGSY